MAALRHATPPRSSTRSANSMAWMRRSSSGDLGVGRRVARQAVELGLDLSRMRATAAGCGCRCVIASGIECVTNSTVKRVPSHSASSSSCILRRVSASSAANGSSISRTSGSIAMPRAIATRCFMPPDSVCGRLSANAVEVRPCAMYSQRLLLARPGATSGRSVRSGNMHVLLDRLPRQQLVELLEHHHAIGSRARHRLALEPDLAFDRLQVAADRLEQRRLAAAGGPEQDEAVRPEHLEVDAVGRGDEVSRVLYCSVTPRTSSSGVAALRDRSLVAFGPGCHGSRSRSTLPPVMMTPTRESPRQVERALEQARERHRRRRLDDVLQLLPDQPHRAHDRTPRCRYRSRVDDARAARQTCAATARAQPVGDRRRSAGTGSTRRCSESARRIVGVRRARRRARGCRRRSAVRRDRRARQQPAAAARRDDRVEVGGPPRAAPAPPCPAPRSRASRRTDGPASRRSRACTARTPPRAPRASARRIGPRRRSGGRSPA